MTPRVLLTAVAAAAVVVAGLGAAPGARAVSGSPPVTAPDRLVAYPGTATVLQPLTNDTDPDGDELAVCRVEADLPRGIRAEPFGEVIGVSVRRTVDPGTYTLTYYACDFSYLVPGTVSLVVEEVREPRVQKIADRPGRLRVTNRADFGMLFLYGDRREDEPDGAARVPSGESVVVRVDRTRIDWIAFSPRKGLLLGRGQVTGIELPRGDRGPLGTPALSPKVLDAWRG